MEGVVAVNHEVQFGRARSCPGSIDQESECSGSRQPIVMHPVGRCTTCICHRHAQSKLNMAPSHEGSLVLIFAENLFHLSRVGPIEPSAPIEWGFAIGVFGVYLGAVFQ